jgi:hypothetical protein
MVATYDLTTPVGKVRLLIPDRDISNALFSDDELTEFLSMGDNNIFLAAADALEAIAGDPQRLRSFTRGSLSGDSQAAINIQRRARQLREQASAALLGGRAVMGYLERGDFYE